MPIYEFICPDCGWEFEELVRNAEAADEVRCPACDSPYVLKKISTNARRANAGDYASSASGASACSSSGST